MAAQIIGSLHHLLNLDGLVAEKVMEFKPKTSERARFEERYFDEYDRPVLRLDNIGTTCDIMDPVFFEPSTRIDHAWEVVEKMAEGDPRWGFTLRRDGAGPYRAIFRRPESSGIAETALLAICRAALKAVEGKP